MAKATIESLPDTTKPPQVPKASSDDPILGNLGDRFNDALKNVTVSDDKKQESKHVEKPTKPEPKKEEKVETTPEKPSSALEAALGEPKVPEIAKPDLAALDKLEADLDKIETPKSEDWKRAREARKLLRDELTKAQSAPPKVDANLEVLTKENVELKERLQKQETNLKAINAEYSEDFQNLLADREKVLGKVASKMKYSGSDRADELVAALGMPEGKLKTTAVKDAMSELDADDKIAVRALIERLDETDEKITEFRKDLPGQFERLQERKKLSAHEQAEKESKLQETEFRKVIEELPKEIVRLRQLSDDAPDAKTWNDPIRPAIESAFKALRPNGTDFRGTVSLAIKGALYDNVWNDYVAQNKELREANARLKEFDQGSPDFKGGKAPAKGKQKPETAEDYERIYHSANPAAVTTP